MQQWIYEFCYQLGMHLKFRNRRRILNGPELIARESYEQQAGVVYANVARKANPKVGLACDHFLVGLRCWIFSSIWPEISMQSLSLPAALAFSASASAVFALSMALSDTAGAVVMAFFSLAMFPSQRFSSAANTGDVNSAAEMNNPAIAECFMGISLRMRARCCR
ncbi:putative Tfp pilus assembly protein [Pseudomonas serbica]